MLSSNLQRALLRKDPTFAEQDYGFRFATRSNDVDEAFQLLRTTVEELMKELGGDPLRPGERREVGA